MSAANLWQHELATLCLLVETQQRQLAIKRAEENRHDRAAAQVAVIEALHKADSPLTSSQLAARSGTRPKQVDYILTLLLKNKTVTRRRSATRRADGQGFRNLYKYRVIAK